MNNHPAAHLESREWSKPNFRELTREETYFVGGGLPRNAFPGQSIWNRRNEFTVILDGVQVN
jgi:hypothetical protein